MESWQEKVVLRNTLLTFGIKDVCENNENILANLYDRGAVIGPL